jgi:hypothetical protein
VDDLGPRREPFIVRHGLLASLALAAVALVTAVAGADAGPAPYGAAGCAAPDGTGPRVDVAVRAQAQAPDGSPAPALPGSGVEAGASVRDLSGYAAEDVGRCDVVHVAVHLHDPALGGSVAGALEGPLGAVEVPARGGRGSLLAEDWRTWQEGLPDGAPTDPADRAAWFVTLTDPAPGEYVLRGRVTASTGASGDVEVVLTLAPRAA